MRLLLKIVLGILFFNSLAYSYSSNFLFSENESLQLDSERLSISDYTLSEKANRELHTCTHDIKRYEERLIALEERGLVEDVTLTVLAEASVDRSRNIEDLEVVDIIIGASVPRALSDVQDVVMVYHKLHYVFRFYLDVGNTDFCSAVARRFARMLENSAESRIKLDKASKAKYLDTFSEVSQKKELANRYIQRNQDKNQ